MEEEGSEMLRKKKTVEKVFVIYSTFGPFLSNYTQASKPNRNRNTVETC